MGYLTASSIPADTICRILFIPDNDEFIANVTGALQLLTFPENWVQYGLLTPTECANALVDMFDKFCFNVKGCRMIGEVILWAGSSAPSTDFLLCDGSSLLRSDYPDLFTIIGTTYGTVDGTHFNIPDLRQRVPIGVGGSFALAGTGGETDHTLTIAEIPAHTHTNTPHGHTTLPHTHVEGIALPSLAGAPVVPVPAALPAPGVTAPSGVTVLNSGIVIDNTGGGAAHNNMQPYIAMNYYIVAVS